jgi:hypothetical protein
VILSAVVLWNPLRSLEVLFIFIDIIGTLSVNCESRNTELNARGFGEYVQLEEDK